MVIGIDAGCLSGSDMRLQTGIYYYAYNLIKNLSKIDKKNIYRLYSYQPVSKSLLDELDPNIQNCLLKPRKYWLNLRLSYEFMIRKPDIFIGLSQALPIYHPAKNVIIVHDIAFEMHPEYYKNSHKRLSRLTRFAVNNADQIIAVSKKTKEDIVQIYGVDRHKIEVIYHGVDPFFYPRKKNESEKVIKKYDIKDPYFLFVGSYKHVKNIPRIIEAFSKFSLINHEEYQLVMAGSDNEYDHEIDRTLEKTKIKNRVKMLGYVPYDDLPLLYSGATAFVSPSLYEGFGLPIAEALSCGVPVVAGDKGSMPEIVGNLGIIVDPYNIQEITGAFMKVLKFDRCSFLSKSVKYSKKFSWNRTARQLINVIKKYE